MSKSGVFHLGLIKNDLQGAMLAIVPGDPERVEKIAALMDKPVKLASYREFTSWCVELDGKLVVVRSTGIGGPSTSIAVEELVQLGVRTFLRIGTTGTIQLHINIGDVPVTTVPARPDGASLHFTPTELPAVVDFVCTTVLVEAAKSIGATTYIGVIASSDTFYPGQECYDTSPGRVVSRFKSSMEEQQVVGVMNYEMESATLLTMCASQGLRAGMVIGVIVNRTQQEIPNIETMKQTESHTVKVVVGAAHRLLQFNPFSVRPGPSAFLLCIAPRRKSLLNWMLVQHSSILCHQATAGSVVDLSIIISAVIALAAGLMVGWLAVKARVDQIRVDLIEERRELDIEPSATRQQLVQEAHRREEYELLNNELRSLRDINTSLEVDPCEVTTRLESTQLRTEDKIRQIVNSEQRLSEQLGSLANRIFEYSSRRVDEQNHLSLHSLLTPLREQLDGFHRQVQESFGQEARERHILTHEIRNLQQLSAQMVQEAPNLTKALRDDNKIQGNWGGMVLTRVLEASGLREGCEYQTQVSIKTDNRSWIQPDVIVHPPQGRDAVVDAKMTLVAYERYFNAEDDYTREVALQEHLVSARNHIRLLGRKGYQQLPRLRSFDYALMLIFVEPAFLAAINRQSELINEALQNNIVPVSPTALLVVLRTIANLWRYEHQSRNAQRIAEWMGRLYDKMRPFVDDMSVIGQSLDKVQENYRQAMKKLVSGRGDLLAQVETFRGLGVGVKRGINPDLVEQATVQDDEYRLENGDSLPENDAFSADPAEALHNREAAPPR